MREIEGEIRDNDGIYPQNGGRLTQAELCRRAGISQATLQNAIHKSTTLVRVNKWLKAVPGLAANGRKAAKQAVTRRADDWKARYQLLATQYNISRLEVAELQEKLVGVVSESARLSDRALGLEKEIEALRVELSQGKVIQLRRGK